MPIDEATTIRTFVIPPMPDTTGYVEVTFPFDDMNRQKENNNMEEPTGNEISIHDVPNLASMSN